MLDHGDRTVVCRSARGAIVVAVSLLVLMPTTVNGQWLPFPPWQQTSGPGGSDYRWAQVTTTAYVNSQNGDLSYWIVAPAEWRGAGAAPAELPLVLFLHGWGANHPVYYQFWLNHLARKGRIVIFPVYQNAATLSMFFTSNAIASTQQALAQIGPGKRGANGLSFDAARGLTLVGHSAGASTAINVAAQYAANHLPEPAALLLVNPFDATVDADLSRVPSTALLDCIVGDDDDIVGRRGCDAIWDRTGHLGAANRNYIWMFSDSRGNPPLVASHYVPLFPSVLDFRGVWKLADAIADCAAYQSNCASALGGGVPQTDMGLWSDGSPIRPLAVTIQKPPCPPRSHAAGC